MFEISGNLAFALLALGVVLAWYSYQSLSAEAGPLSAPQQFPIPLMWVGLLAGVLMICGGAKMALDAASVAAEMGSCVSG